MPGLQACLRAGRAGQRHNSLLASALARRAARFRVPPAGGVRAASDPGEKSGAPANAARPVREASTGRGRLCGGGERGVDALARGRPSRGGGGGGTEILRGNRLRLSGARGGRGKGGRDGGTGREGGAGGDEAGLLPAVVERAAGVRPRKDAPPRDQGPGTVTAS